MLASRAGQLAAQSVLRPATVFLAHQPSLSSAQALITQARLPDGWKGFLACAAQPLDRAGCKLARQHSEQWTLSAVPFAAAATVTSARHAALQASVCTARLRTQAGSAGLFLTVPSVRHFATNKISELEVGAPGTIPPDEQPIDKPTVEELQPAQLLKVPAAHTKVYA